MGKPQCALPRLHTTLDFLLGGNPKWEGEGPAVPVKKHDVLVCSLVTFTQVLHSLISVVFKMDRTRRKKKIKLYLCLTRR